MMKKIFFILIIISLSHLGWTQETNHNQFSSAPNTARYEIVQSELGARITLKIDKYLGMVYLLVERDTKLFWQVMHVQNQDAASPDKVSYQIFTSGIGQKFTFLLNVNTGATWQLTEDPTNGVLFWCVLE